MLRISRPENRFESARIVTPAIFVRDPSEPDQVPQQFWLSRMLRPIAKYIYQLLKPAFRPIAFRVRNYLIDGLRQEIQQEIRGASATTAQKIQQEIRGASATTAQKIQQEIRGASAAMAQEIQQAIQRASAVLPIAPLLESAQMDRNYLDAGTLHSLYTQWSFHSEILGQATLVVACPLTADAARELLHPSEMVIIASPQDWLLVLSGRRWDVIALVGLDLMQQALQSSRMPYQLVRACSRELLYFVKSDDVFHQRRALHQVGFCEVASVLSDGRLDNFTTGWSTKGDFVLRGSLPVLSWPGGEWCLHRASRVGQLEGHGTYRWQSILGNGLQVSKLGWTGISNELLLSICQGSGTKNSLQDWEQRVTAVMQWPLSSGEGHASLVGGYHGPGDLKMALAMINVGHSGAATFSLWWHDDQWKCLKSIQLSAEDCHLHNGYCQVDCWLHLSEKYIHAGCGDRVLLEESLTHGLCATTAGIRIYSNHIAVKDFDVQTGGIHV